MSEEKTKCLYNEVRYTKANANEASDLGILSKHAMQKTRRLKASGRGYLENKNKQPM